jgi:hypothetical protein
MRSFKLAIGVGTLLLAAVAAAGDVGIPRAPSFASWMHIVHGDGWYQIRSNERVIIRIPNKSAPAGNKRYKEEKVGKCLLLDRLIGSRPGPKESLEILTRDGNVIRAYLGDGCLAREFYAGAYVERSADGMFCIDRDLLHARTGAQCEVDRFRLLVPE